MMSDSVMDRKPPAADERIPYGPGKSQFGDLWLPKPGPGIGDKKGFVPLIVFLHGGWWQSQYDLAYAGELCAALRADGLAVWSIEYRRVGSTGGGWPATFQDVAAGFDYVPRLAQKHPIDLTRVLAVGHSAGGHLAFWLAGRHHIPETSPLYQEHVFGPNLCGVIGLAAAVDLRLTIDLSADSLFAHDKREVASLMGGLPAQVPDRYKAGNPGDLLPLNIPQILIQGSEDSQIPPQLPQRWAELAKSRGDLAVITMVQHADHFDVVDPRSRAWPAVRGAVKALVK